MLIKCFDRPSRTQATAKSSKRKAIIPLDTDNNMEEANNESKGQLSAEPIPETKDSKGIDQLDRKEKSPT